MGKLFASTSLANQRHPLPLQTQHLSHTLYHHKHSIIITIISPLGRAFVRWITIWQHPATSSALSEPNTLVCLRHLQQREHCLFSCGLYIPWNVHARKTASSYCTKTHRLGCHTNLLATCSMTLDQDMIDRCASLKHGQARPK